MEFKISVNLDNAAFQDDTNNELFDILDMLAEDVRKGDKLKPGDKFPLFDSQGNTIGEAKVCL